MLHKLSNIHVNKQSSVYSNGDLILILLHMHSYIRKFLSSSYNEPCPFPPTVFNLYICVSMAWGLIWTWWFIGCGNRKTLHFFLNRSTLIIQSSSVISRRERERESNFVVGDGMVEGVDESGIVPEIAFLPHYQARMFSSSSNSDQFTPHSFYSSCSANKELAFCPC